MIRPFSLSRGTEELDLRHAGIMQMVMDRASTESFSKRTMRDFLFLGSLAVFIPSAAAQGEPPSETVLLIRKKLPWFAPDSLWTMLRGTLGPLTVKTIAEYTCRLGD